MIKVKKRIFLILGFVNILLLFYGFIIIQPSDHNGLIRDDSSLNYSRQEDKNTSTNEEFAIFKEQIARLEDQQHKLLQQLQELRTVVHVQVPSISEPQPNDQGTPESTESWQNPLEDHNTTDPLSTYNSAFEEEPDDPDWKLEIETTVMVTFEELGLTDTLLNQVECRETACRLEFLHPDGNEGESFIETILSAEPFTTEFYSESVVKADGSHTTLVFIARPTYRSF